MQMEAHFSNEPMLQLSVNKDSEKRYFHNASESFMKLESLISHKCNFM